MRPEPLIWLFIDEMDTEPKRKTAQSSSAQSSSAHQISYRPSFIEVVRCWHTDYSVTMDDY